MLLDRSPTNIFSFWLEPLLMIVFIFELWLMTKLSVPKSLTFSSSSTLLFFLRFLTAGLTFFFSYFNFQNLIRPSFAAVRSDCGLSFKKSLKTKGGQNQLGQRFALITTCVIPKLTRVILLLHARLQVALIVRSYSCHIRVLIHYPTPPQNISHRLL